MKAKDDLSALNSKKDKLILDFQAKAAEAREIADGKVMEIRTVMLETQKDLSGQQDLNSLLRKQLAQLELERNKLGDIVQNKDFLVDKLKEELILLNRTMANQGSMNRLSEDKDYEMKSQSEFRRLIGLTEQLKDTQVEVERSHMESLAKDKEYLRIKDQLANSLEGKNQALRLSEMVKYENQKLREEQQKFGEELTEIRNIYETQIDSLASKLHMSAEEVIKQKAKTSELLSANNLLKNKADTLRKRLVEKDLELERFTSEKLFEVAQMQNKPRLGPTALLVRGEMGESQLENSPELREDLTRSLAKLRNVKNEPREDKTRDMFVEDKARLDWESLMYRVNSIGSGN